MNLRLTSIVLALALPLAAQTPAASASETENLFYKAFWLEKGERNSPAAMLLYEEFLAKAPEHRLAKPAAQQQLGLLHRAGKTKEAEAFAQKHERLLGKNPPLVGGGDAERGEGERGEGRPRGQGDRPAGERPAGEGGGDPRGGGQERLAQLEKDLAKAKEEGNEAKVKELTQQIDQLKARIERAGQGGQGGDRPRGGFNFRFAEMGEEQLANFKQTILPRMEERDITTANEARSEEHTSELQSPCNLVCRLLLEKKKKKN